MPNLQEKNPERREEEAIKPSQPECSTMLGVNSVLNNDAESLARTIVIWITVRQTSPSR